MTAAELRTIRRALGWTQATAAERLGVHARTYKYYEAGETSFRGAPAADPSGGRAGAAVRFLHNVDDLNLRGASDDRDGVRRHRPVRSQQNKSTYQSFGRN